MAPVFSLTLDRDVPQPLATLYPELYRDLTSNTTLSYTTFFIWVAVSIYQGCIIQGLSQLLTSINSPKMVAVSFTVLILNELFMVVLEVTTWHYMMIVSLVGTLCVYLGSIPFLGVQKMPDGSESGYFDLQFVASVAFVWRVAVVLSASLLPIAVSRLVMRKIRPESFRKVQGV